MNMIVVCMIFSNSVVNANICRHEVSLSSKRKVHLHYSKNIPFYSNDIVVANNETFIICIAFLQI